MPEIAILRTMQPEELEFAAACTAAEGWQGETILESAAVYIRDPAGCFIAEVDGKPAGMCMGVYYGGFGFLGGLIVQPAARGQSLGQRLLLHTVAYLQSRGAKSVFLDGVLKAVPMYERSGFAKVSRSLRLRGRLAGKAHRHIRPMHPEHIDEVCRLDKRAFGADRRFFLERRLHLFPSLCKIAEVNGCIEGFIMGRIGHTVISSGPWIVSDRLERPLDLLEVQALEVPLAPLALGCLDANTRAAEALRGLGFWENPASPWRMVYGDYFQPGDVSMNYAIGSATKG